jgi:hypothetical protein
MLRITPKLVAATWDYLREVLPLRAPPADEIRIVCNKNRNILAEWAHRSGAEFRLTVNITDTGALAELIRLLAHEMVHAHQTMTGEETRGEHNADFYRLWRICARRCGWDERRTT